MRILCFAAAAAIAGCTTIHSVGGGSEPGEFYVAAQRSYLVLPGPTYVSRCAPDPATHQPTCSVILIDKEFGQQTGPQVADYRQWYRVCSATGAAEGRAGKPKASHVDTGSSISRIGQAGCDAGYSAAYDLNSLAK